MQWLLFGLIALTSAHVLAILLGSPRGSGLHRAAVASGVLGLLSIPVALVAIVSSLCIAGGCERQRLPLGVIAVAFALALAASSMILVIAVSVRRRHI